MNILCKNIEQKYQDAVNYAKSVFNEKTTSNAVLKMLLLFQKQQKLIERLKEENNQLHAVNYFLETNLKQSQKILNDTFEKMDDRVERYRILTGSLEKSEDQAEE